MDPNKNESRSENWDNTNKDPDRSQDLSISETNNSGDQPATRSTQPKANPQIENQVIDQNNNSNFQPNQNQNPAYNQPLNSSYAAPPPVSNPPVSNSVPTSVLILQWLTYAFWGWTIIAMSCLTGAVIYSLLGKGDPGNFTIYSMAAVLVLLPISVICDHFYTKNEPEKKQGASSVIMIIHAVIFALFGIGSVITMVFAAVTSAVSSGDSTWSLVTFLTAAVVTVLYAAVFLRTMAFRKLKLFKKHFIKIMIGIVGIMIILAIVVPIRIARETRDDRLISENLDLVERAIQEYSNDNEKLPENLKELDLKEDAKTIVDRNLIKYTPNTKSPSSDLSSEDNLYRVGRNSTSEMVTYYYTMCVNYVKDSQYDDYGYGSSYGAEDKDDYTSSPNFYSYKAGENCYKIKTLDY